jgi:hypothetical protein
MPDARQLGIVEHVAYTATPELTCPAREAPHPQPIGESMAIEQHHRASFDQTGPRPGPSRGLRQTLEHRTVEASPDEQVGGE